jgi:serine/threonine protein kinase
MLINRKSREGYGKAVDWWSLGTLLYEMLTGWPPFYDKNLRKMCENILKSDLAFPPSCSASHEARDLIRGLLMRDPASRLGSRAAGVDEIKAHPFFRGIDWVALEKLEVEPPFKPTVSASDIDIGNFDATFTNEPAELTPPDPSELADATSEAAAASGGGAGAGGASGGGINSSNIDDFADFGFVNTHKLKSTLKAIFGLDTPSSSGGGAASAGAGHAGDEDDDGVAAAASATAGGDGDRVSHKDAPVTPELEAHLKKLAMEAGVTEEA